MFVNLWLWSMEVHFFWHVLADPLLLNQSIEYILQIIEVVNKVVYEIHLM
jgi:hypothetical protein